MEDVPKVWNAKMKELLGEEPPSDAQGCLQDVHWSAGLFGYFPTYSLGAMYATQVGADPCRSVQIRAGQWWRRRSGLGGLMRAAPDRLIA